MIYDFEPYSHLLLRPDANQQYYPFSGSLYPEKSLKNKKFFTTVLVYVDRFALRLLKNPAINPFARLFT